MIKKEFVFLVFLFAINRSNGFFYNDTPIIESLKENNVHYKNYYNPFLNQTVDLLEIFSKNDGINSACKNSLKRWINGIEENEAWAFKFLEATGK